MGPTWVQQRGFNATPIHWELLARARAADNQVFVAAVSPATARDKKTDYVSWGHSIVVDPFSSVMASAAGGGEEIVYADIDLNLVEEARQQMPRKFQIPHDFYETNLVNLYMER